ncbi:ABC transporter ATP-binding protein [Rhizobium sp. LEGMi198b]
MSSRAIVTLNGVTKTYGHFTALHETDLEVGEGEFVTLLGPSGCGKTTTLRLIGGFEYANSGIVSIAGQDVTAAPPFRRPVNTVFQDYALFPHMTVAQNIAYGLSVKGAAVASGERKKRVEEALAMVGLETMGNRVPAALSGGQRQRVAMARAIVRRPRVLLLDEPLSALDVKLREGMQVELKRLHRELGITFLMVTHDQAEALALSDRIVVMNQGKIVQIGAPTELYDNPSTPYVADFIGASNLVPARYEARDGDCDMLRLSNGTLLRRTGKHHDSAVKGTITAGIRPERIRLDVFDGANTMEARIVETLFHGDRMRLELALAGDAARIFADIPRVAGTSRQLEPGAVISLHVDPADVMLFAPEPSA